MTTGDLELEVLDGGAGVVVVPASSVFVVIGPATGGDVEQVVATRNPNTLKSVFTGGPLVEAGGLIIAAGGTVLAMRGTTNVAGEASDVTMTRVGSSTCEITVTGEPVDEYYVVVKITKGGTVGDAGIRFKLSLDAGRSYGPELALGVATSYEILDTGLTLEFGTGTLEKGDTAKFGCSPPKLDTAAVQACVTALKLSPYAITGWGGGLVVTPFSGADQATIETYLDELAENKTFTRFITELADVSPPEIWGGTGEDESTWMTNLGTEMSSLSAVRLSPCGGNYNMPSAYPTRLCGTPKYRRNGAWALACRQVTIPAQRHAGRVSDGGLAQIVVDKVNDPSDGFVYHDERTTPGLNDFRCTSFRTRLGKPGIFVRDPRLASPPGSVFTLLPLGNVMDIGCTILNQTGEQYINADILLNDNGTIAEKEAQAIERAILGAFNVNMTSKKMISNATVAVDRSNNVRADSEVNIAATLYSRGYILQINATIGFASPFAATGS